MLHTINANNRHFLLKTVLLHDVDKESKSNFTFFDVDDPLLLDFVLTLAP